MRTKHQNRNLWIVILGATCVLSSACSDSSPDPTDSGVPDVAQPKPDATPDVKETDTTKPDTANPDVKDDDTANPDVKDNDTVNPDVKEPDVIVPDVKDEKRPDVADADTGDCPVTPVWNANSGVLRMKVEGGMPPANPVCRGPGFYDFSPGTQTLTQSGCIGGVPVYKIVHLSGAETARLTTEISALRTTCSRSCALDAPMIALTIQDTSACVQQIYEGNFEGACGTPLPPYVEYASLDSLRKTLADVVQNVCSGSPTDAGKCDTPADAGGFVCPIRPIVDAGTSGDAGSTSDATDGGPDDAPTCTPPPVWWGSSSGFTLTRSGGLPPGLLDAGCSTQPLSYTFSKDWRTLVQAGCLGGTKVRREVSLTDAQLNQITTATAALPSTCTASCNLDAPFYTLTVRNCSGYNDGIFHSSTSASSGCSGPVVDPPYIDLFALDQLGSLLATTIVSSCTARADAGVCGGSCREE